MQFLPMKVLPSSASIFLFLVSVLVILCSTEAVIKLPGNLTVSAVIVFGDSIVDTGNNNNLKTVAKCNFPPYGRDFKGGLPTGRFSNGKVPSDLLGFFIFPLLSNMQLFQFLVEELGVKELSPAYLDPNLKPEDLLTGVNFASGGAGYDILTTRLSAEALSLSDQLRLFKEYIEKLKAIVGEEGKNRIFETSLFVVVAGSNDINNNYFGSRIRRLQYDISTYTDLLVRLASSFFKELYGLGVRRIGVFGLPPLGCLPSTRTLAGGINRECAKDYNEAAELLNSKLSAESDSLSSKLPNSKIVYIDIYNPLLQLIQNPDKYGFEIANKGCCGTGLIEVIILCNRFSPQTCPNDNIYLFWDSFHPTEKAYKILVSNLVKKYVNNFF